MMTVQIVVQRRGSAGQVLREATVPVPVGERYLALGSEKFVTAYKEALKKVTADVEKDRKSGVKTIAPFIRAVDPKTGRVSYSRPTPV